MFYEIRDEGNEEEIFRDFWCEKPRECEFDNAQNNNRNQEVSKSA